MSGDATTSASAVGVRVRPAPAESPAELTGSLGCRAGMALLVLAVLAALSLAYVVVSAAVYAGNSDDATLVLQGQSVAAGHLTLAGWDLSYDAFWTSDVPFYAVGVGLAGVAPVLMHAVPAAILAVLVAAAGWCGLDRGITGRDPAAARAAVGSSLSVVAVALALPGPNLSYFLLQAGWHAVTALYCLLAFALTARSASRRSLLLAAALLAAALLGDLLTAVVGLAPLLASAGLSAWQARSWRAGARAVCAAALAIVLAVAGRLLALAAGTYAIGSRSVLAGGHQVLVNALHLPLRVGGLFDVLALAPPVPQAAWPLRIAHGAVLLGVVAASVGAAASLASPRRRASMPAVAASGEVERQLDAMLLFGALAALAAYVIFATDSNFALARYLVPGVVFAVVVAARVAGRLAAWLVVGGDRPPSTQAAGRRRRSRWLLATAAAAVAACCAVGFGVDSVGPAAPLEAAPLTAFLQRHGLREGVGDYWSASIVTVESSGAVAVRPVVLTAHGRLARYDKQTAGSWFAGRRFTFFVSDAANPWQGVDSTAAERALGTPARSYAVGSYRVLVYPTGFTVSAGR